jgi:hypothetical protein
MLTAISMIKFKSFGTLGHVLSTCKQLPALWIGVVRPSAGLILKMEALRFFETSVTVAVDKT